ncbi:MAG: hypothetical protein A2W99_10250 [Bacteroidetes bacterium GWF2_33_16]|nr:MAG: hypothetical protein A2X00_05490 [Bacteroidetes bacterium GWE2_32_14]OFY03929.1 MAG: hypothetical protein A2W99_10250 [Bacteroidetes bacterium GWF2_33_16]
MSVNNTINHNQKFYIKLIYINAFITGAVVMAMEMTGSRFLTPFFGSSVYTWASIISMVLLSLSAGYFIGGYLAEKKPYSFFLGYFLYIAAVLILFIPLYYVQLFNYLYEIIPDTKAGGFVGALITLFLPLLMLGMYSPYSVKLGSVDSIRVGKISGNLYAISTIGSIVGTLGVTFILIPLIGLKTITISLSAISALSGLSLVFFHPKENNELNRNKKSKKNQAWVLLILYLALLMLVSFWGEIFHSSLKNKTSSTILEEVESEYNHILIKQKGEYVTMGFYHYGANHLESSINILNEYELPLSYAQIMPVGLIYSNKAKNLLMIGMGGGAVTKYIQSYLKNIDITGVELDEKVIDLAKKYFGLVEKDNYKVIIEDGRIFMHRSKDTFDIIMLDAYKGGYIPFHLCTQEFYQMIENHMNKNGCAVFNLHRGSKLFNRTILTLETVFDNVDLYGSKTKGNAIAVAYNGPSKPISELNKTADSLQNQYNFFYNLKDLSGIRFNIVVDQKQKALTDDFAPVNFLNAIQEHNEKTGD